MTAVNVTIIVDNPAYLDAAADALQARGMIVHYRSKRPRYATVVGSISLLLLPRLALVGGCRLEGSAI